MAISFSILRPNEKTIKKDRTYPSANSGSGPKSSMTHSSLGNTFPNLKSTITSLFRSNNANSSSNSYMSRLTFVLNANEYSAEEVMEFQETKKSEWDRVAQVTIRSRDKIECCICLT